MLVGVMTLDLVLHAPLSLKEKRGVVKKILARVRSAYPVSAAETGYHDLWQRCRLGFSMVGTDEGMINNVFSAVEEDIYQSGLAEITGQNSEILRYS